MGFPSHFSQNGEDDQAQYHWPNSALLWVSLSNKQCASVGLGSGCWDGSLPLVILAQVPTKLIQILNLEKSDHVIYSQWISQQYEWTMDGTYHVELLTACPSLPEPGHRNEEQNLDNIIQQHNVSKLTAQSRFISLVLARHISSLLPHSGILWVPFWQCRDPFAGRSALWHMCSSMDLITLPYSERYLIRLEKWNCQSPDNDDQMKARDDISSSLEN